MLDSGGCVLSAGCPRAPPFPLNPPGMTFQSGVAAVDGAPYKALTWLVAIVLVGCIALFLGMLGAEVWRSVRFARTVLAVRKVSTGAAPVARRMTHRTAAPQSSEPCDGADAQGCHLGGHPASGPGDADLRRGAPLGRGAPADGALSVDGCWEGTGQWVVNPMRLQPIGGPVAAPAVGSPGDHAVLVEADALALTMPGRGATAAPVSMASLRRGSPASSIRRGRPSRPPLRNVQGGRGDADAALTAPRGGPSSSLHEVVE